MAKIPGAVWLGLLAGAWILMIGAGLRHSFGIFLPPITAEFGWGREVFSLGFAIQMFLLGFGSPVAGLIADRFGTGRVLITGAIFQALGLYLVASASTPTAFYLTTGVMMGLGASAVSNVVVIGAIGRMVGVQRVSRAVGILMAGASMGQILMLPAAHFLISSLGWSRALVILSGVALSVMLVLPLLIRGQPARQSSQRDQKVLAAIREARGHAGYRWLNLGFFVCGFHVFFLATHLPAYAKDLGLAPVVGANALMLIGIFNMIGVNVWGYLGDRYSKKRMLSLIYLLRALVISGFLLLPAAEISVYLFSAAMGFIWLGTVPLTSGMVRQIFGAQYLSMLYGMVFMSHQVGGFLGAWLAGWLFDATGNYTVMWGLSIGLAILAAMVHHPIDEKSLEAGTPAGQMT